MRLAAALALLFCLLPRPGHTVEMNLATLTCDQYQNDIMNSATPVQGVDPINTMMWLFGFSVAKSGAHVMYGDALASFGFALDAQCKDHPNMVLLDAVMAVQPKRDNPMDLMTLTCATFEPRHAELKGKDAESATTIMMWLFGYAIAKSGGHVLDPGAVSEFESALEAQCKAHPEMSVYDALTADKSRKPVAGKRS